jgi:hypothetical protein
MLLNLSGAHAPFFTRHLAILSDGSGHEGVGEVPGGEKIRQTIEDARALLIGQPIGEHRRLLQAMRQRFADRDAGGDADIRRFKKRWRRSLRPPRQPASPWAFSRPSRLARRYMQMGATFVAVGSDLGVLRMATQALFDKYRATDAAPIAAQY